MAIDTRNKRASILGVGHTLPTPILPLADTLIDEADRQQLVWLYAGIQAGQAVIPAMVQYVGVVSVGDNYVGEVA